jgi:hypothetical protein
MTLNSINVNATVNAGTINKNTAGENTVNNWTLTPEERDQISQAFKNKNRPKIAAKRLPMFTGYYNVTLMVSGPCKFVTFPMVGNQQTHEPLSEDQAINTALELAKNAGYHVLGVEKVVRCMSEHEGP